MSSVLEGKLFYDLDMFTTIAHVSTKLCTYATRVTFTGGTW